MYEREISRLQLVHVAKKLRLGVVRAENRMRHERCRALEPLVVAVIHGGKHVLDKTESGIAPAVEGSKNREEIFFANRLVQGDYDFIVVAAAEIDAATFRI